MFDINNERDSKMNKKKFGGLLSKIQVKEPIYES